MSSPASSQSNLLKSKNTNPVRGNTDWNRPPWPGTTVTICVNHFTTGDPGKEHGSNKPPRTTNVQRTVKRKCHMSSQNPPCWNPSWLSNTCTGRKDPASESLPRDKPETIPTAIKPETASHVVDQSSWAPLPCCCLPRHPFPINSLFLSAWVSSRAIRFRVLGKSPLSGPGRGPSSCNNPMTPFAQNHQ